MTDRHPLRWLCSLGFHRFRRLFVGDSWTPDAYVTACTRCGWEKGY